jgi:hypothetical protein
MTKEEYAEYERKFGLWHEQARFPSSGDCEGCEECTDVYCYDLQHGRTPEIEAHFSWEPCEVCGSKLGGDRYPIHSVDANGDILHWEACLDCVYYIEYGRLDDMTMLEIED